MYTVSSYFSALLIKKYIVNYQNKSNYTIYIAYKHETHNDVELIDKTC